MANDILLCEGCGSEVSQAVRWRSSMNDPATGAELVRHWHVGCFSDGEAPEPTLRVVPDRSEEDEDVWSRKPVGWWRCGIVLTFLAGFWGTVLVFIAWAIARRG